MASDPVEIASWLAKTLAERFAESIETMSGERPGASSRPAEGEVAPEGALWWEQPFNLGPGTKAVLGVPQAAWLAIGKYILTSAGVESSEESEARSTFLEISSQALSGLARAVGSRLGKTVACENGAESGAAPPDTPGFDIELKLGEAEPVSLRVHISQELLDLLKPQESSGAEMTRAPEMAPAAGPMPEHSGPGRTGNTIELLMEVELPVSVSFGRADLALKDVLKLTTGSIIELNRVLTEPVEVIVNNCVIARGEVVVIDGNYGVRIHEIISRDKRLRTLR